MNGRGERRRERGRRWAGRSGPPLARLLVAVLVLVSGALMFCAAASARQFVVTSSGDQGDANPGNGFCATPGMFASCTLRAAVEEANAYPGADEIVIGAGTISLASGQLSIDDDVSIRGAGARQTIVRTNGGGHRIAQVGPSIAVTISDLTLRGGGGAQTSVGGAVFNSGDLVLTRVWLDANRAASCGAVYVTGSLLVRDSTLTANFSYAAGGAGGALCLVNGAVATLINATLHGNAASEGGAIFTTGMQSSLELYSCTFIDNVDTEPTGRPSSALEIGLGALHLDKTLIVGSCAFARVLPARDHRAVTSNGGNIESPGEGCLLGAPGDLNLVARRDLHLGTLGDYGGPVPTVLPGTLSVAVEPPLSGAACSAEDARGAPRVGRCDVGAVERQLGDPESGPLFEDDWESGDLSAWSAAAP
ncbi:MAG: CSLREA domain-containing protein [Acidobacteria bacterium]|nr:MAG: CSLREA domain-containing protein [Acidobacteriota bacterium]